MKYRSSGNYRLTIILLITVILVPVSVTAKAGVPVQFKWNQYFDQYGQVDMSRIRVCTYSKGGLPCGKEVADKLTDRQQFNTTLDMNETYYWQVTVNFVNNNKIKRTPGDTFTLGDNFSGGNIISASNIHSSNSSKSSDKSKKEVKNKKEPRSKNTNTSTRSDTSTRRNNSNTKTTKTRVNTENSDRRSRNRKKHENKKSEIDRTNPADTFNLLHPDDGTNTNASILEFDWEESFDTGTGLSHYMFQVCDV